jgi:hypothetical protein
MEGDLEQLQQSLLVLDVDEILALCYTFQAKPARLRDYMNVLRKRGGERAQFSSCLICFDLARQGDESAQQEFHILADTMRQLGERENLVENLVSGDQYLTFIWELCQAQIEELDPRFAADVVTMDTGQEMRGSLDLLGDDDFEDLGFFQADDSTLWRQFDEAVETFLGGEVGVPVYDPDSGFRLHSSRDSERLERFLQELESLRQLVPPSRGFRTLALLFYGTHMSTRSLFGTLNKRKEALLRDGIAEFVESASEVWDIAGVMGPLHAEPGAWEKMADVMLDYTRWFSQQTDKENISMQQYDALGRLGNALPDRVERRRGSR